MRTWILWAELGEHQETVTLEDLELEAGASEEEICEALDSRLASMVENGLDSGWTEE